MKRIFCFLMSGLLAGGVHACDICGCAASGSYFGILPHFSRHFVSVRYGARSFTSRHIGAENNPALVSKDRFRTAELFARYNVNYRLQAFAVLPFQYSSQAMGAERTTLSGAGDITLMAAYNLLNTADVSVKPVKHLLQVAAGVKLPTGRQGLQSNGKTAPLNLQPGTGSFDFPVSLLYTVRKGGAGLSTEINYRLNTARAQNQAGNKLNTSVRGFYWAQWGKTALLPSLGMAWEHAAINYEGGVYNEYSGGESLHGVLGADLYLSRYIMGLNLQQPLRHTLAKGRIDAGSRWQVSFSVLF